MIVYRSQEGLLAEQDGTLYRLGESSMDTLFAQDDLARWVQTKVAKSNRAGQIREQTLLAPVGNQEVWAAGVTYYRSRSARIEESKDAGGGTFYDRVYSAERPELFFKAQGHKVVGPGRKVRIRSDARWSVPEPELALAINPRGEIIGYTVGNDMSSRDIEGENPLYLPQAKVYDGSCALGPGLLITSSPLEKATRITLEITRQGNEQFAGTTTLAELKRDPETLAKYLYRDQTFAHGCFLLTGTGIVPPDSFTLERGDTIRISIDGVGVLVNEVG